MRRYIALLRGVNISGKNKVPMAELKLGFESLGFPDVRTWLNSGNVVFSSEETEPAALTGQIEGMIQRRFGLEIPVFVLPQEELADTLRHAPDWWGTEDPEVYDNLIFILPPASFQDVYREIGAPKEGLEQIRDERVIAGAVARVLEEHPQSAADYRAGKEKALGFLMGRVMKELKGKADPGAVNALLKSRLETGGSEGG